MCGRFNVIDSLQVRALLSSLGVEFSSGFRFAPDIAPASLISIVRQSGEQRLFSDAIWWLILDPATLKPSRYTSFNSRADKLNDAKSFGYRLFRQSRCIIPASAFIEGLGDGKTYHRIALPDSAIAFGGLYKEWLNKETGETVLSASIITLPPPPDEQWLAIHPKSMPLMLANDDDIFNRWLDPTMTDAEQFSSLLRPGLQDTLLVTPIGKVSRWNPVGLDRLITINANKENVDDEQNQSI
jgi:putative SOS response-associated peptidase YedK